MKEQIIKQVKNKEAPEGFGLSGRVHCFFQDIISLTPGLSQDVLARKEAQQDLPMEKQYIHYISDTAGIQLIVTMLPVMVYPPVLHVPPTARPISDASDRPPTPLGRRSTSHSLSWTLICFYYPSLLGTLNSP